MNSARGGSALAETKCVTRRKLRHYARRHRGRRVHHGQGGPRQRRRPKRGH